MMTTIVLIGLIVGLSVLFKVFLIKIANTKGVPYASWSGAIFMALVCSFLMVFAYIKATEAGRLAEVALEQRNLATDALKEAETLNQLVEKRMAEAEAAQRQAQEAMQEAHRQAELAMKAARNSP